MIVAHYPGAGGYRYCLFLKNAPFHTPDVYMHQPEFECYNYKYLTSNTLQSPISDLTLLKHTHTFDEAMLKKFFPGHKIVKIKADFKQSLCREWRVVMKHHYAQHSIEDQIGQVFDMIVWHDNYYTEYPPNWNIGNVVDIDTDQTEFGKVMRVELSKTDLLFEFAWECFTKYGSNAPIIDLAVEFNRQ